MSARDEEKYAFPLIGRGGAIREGMTLYEYYVGAALQGLCAAEWTEELPYDRIADLACNQAKVVVEMLKAREKSDDGA